MFCTTLIEGYKDKRDAAPAYAAVAESAGRAQALLEELAGTPCPTAALTSEGELETAGDYGLIRFGPLA